jgi:hypothetical protein
LRGFGSATGLEHRIVGSEPAIAAAARAALADVTLGGLVLALQDRVDAHFDHVAAVVVEAIERRAPDERRPRPSAAELEIEALAAHVEVLRAKQPPKRRRWLRRGRRP